MVIKTDKQKSFNPKEIRKVLIIKLRAIGDVLISTAILPNLRNFFKESEIHFLTEPQSEDILKYNKYIDKLIVFGRKQKGYLKFLFELKKQKYDLVIDLFCNPRSAQMTFATQSKYRVGYAFRLRKYAYNILIKSRGHIVHNVDFNLDTLRALTIPLISRKPLLFFGSNEHEFANNFFKKELKDNDKVVGINAGGGWKSKLWDLEKFAELADRLIDNFGYKVIIFWGPGQTNIYKSISSFMKNKPIIPPITTLLEQAALQKRCDFIISNDSGPMHIASALGVPTLGIFGPTRPQFQGPLGDDSTTIVKEGLSCLGCNLTECKIGNLCMKNLSVDEVYKKIIQWRKLYEK